MSLCQATQACLDLPRIKPSPQTFIAARREVLRVQAAPICTIGSELHAIAPDDSSPKLHRVAEESFAKIFDRSCVLHLVQGAEFRNWLRGWLPHYVGSRNGGGRDSLRSARQSATQSVESLLELADRFRATDIHLDPKAELVGVRLRIDGSLADYSPFEPDEFGAIVNRIKVMAGLDIAEQSSPQDGKFQHSTPRASFEIRVSILPSQYGQRVALRLLPRASRAPTLGQLGFSGPQQATIRSACSSTGGLIIVAGPTGSGKSTALFSMMSELLDGGTQCGLTVEDPVEYEIANATQVALGGENQLDFATALRTMLRHDPDVIMVGEIRDAETARIATQAAMTGHLVLSTIHTQNVDGVKTRLVDLGVEDYLLTESLRLAIAGKLEPRRCGDCAGQGCVYCAGSGTNGRIGKFELRSFSSPIDATSSDALPLSASTCTRGL